MPPDTLTLSLLQFEPSPAGLAANLERIEHAARAARAAGSRLLVAPELATTGYASLDAMHALAEPADGPTLRRLAALADALDLALVIGVPERAAAGQVYNAAALLRPGLPPALYRKCHLFGRGERAAFTPGEAPPALHQVCGLQAAMLVCYDSEFPEMARAAALAGADLLLVPTALPRAPSSVTVSQVLLRTRALENHLFVVYAGLCGSEADIHYQGGSSITGPDGEVLAAAGATEALLTVTIRPDARHARGLDPYLRDRRADLFR